MASQWQVYKPPHKSSPRKWNPDPKSLTQRKDYDVLKQVRKTGRGVKAQGFGNWKILELG